MSTPRQLTDAHDLRAAWQRKPSLRRVYEDAYRRMASLCASGPTLEVGGGSGNFKQFAPDTISTDIVTAPWLDAVADATRLPLGDASLANIVMFDVLHHIEFPVLFFDEAARVLRPGGRIVLCEPAITPLSGLFYSHMHPEPVDMRADPFAIGSPDPRRHPFDSNQAIPTLMFKRQRDRFAARFPALAIRSLTYLSLFAYPLTGGFRPWTAVPAALVPALTSLEAMLMPALGPGMAFRMLVVVERLSVSGES